MQNDYQQKHGNSHCVQINEWKALNFVFARNERTEALFKILDRYESTRDAAKFQGGNDGDIRRAEDEKTVSAQIAVRVRGLTRAMIEIEDGQIIRLSCDGLQDDDIVDLHHLPTHLKELSLSDGKLTGMDLSALPRGLEDLFLMENNITTMMIRYIPPSLKELHLGFNPLNEEGVILKLPLPQDLKVRVSFIDSLNVGDGKWQPELYGGEGDDEDYRLVTWPDGTRLKVLSNLLGSI